jgi:hypothetical protein
VQMGDCFLSGGFEVEGLAEPQGTHPKTHVFGEIFLERDGGVGV